MKTSHSSPSGQNHHSTAAAPAANPALATAGVMIGCLPSGLPPVPPPVPDPEADQWATKINDAFGEGLAWILDAGRQLIEAKAALLHGRWTAMFDSGRIKFSMRHATMLMRIAEHRALSNQRHLADLPHCLTTLDVLAGGSAEVVEAGIKAGAIHAELTAKEARTYLRVQSPKLITRTRATKFNAAKRLERVDAVLWREMAKWPDEALGQLAEKLAAFAHDIRNNAPAAHP
jgi:Protein of unknown function (DUF3102)